jgi:tRNA pseudouridine55 synthase
MIVFKVHLLKMPKTELIYKNLGETPLEALERFRAQKVRECESLKSADNGALRPQISASDWKSVSMTYAGRLDPMAEGLLLILIGDECKNKEKYLGLDKEYEVEILFGVSTDTYDILGLVTDVVLLHSGSRFESSESEFASVTTPHFKPNLSRYVGKFSQEYPAYSSKTVNGNQLHQLARAGELPETLPDKEAEIYSIEEVLPRRKIGAVELKTRIAESIDLVKGDFRQYEIKAKWAQTLSEMGEDSTFDVITIKVSCSSGTYMRSLANEMGKDVGIGAIALSIKRTKIGENSI